MKLKIGDKIRIKTRRELLTSGWEYNKDLNEYHPLSDKDNDVIAGSMFHYLGTEVVIINVQKSTIAGLFTMNSYNIQGDEEEYNWTLDMFVTDPLQIIVNKIKKEWVVSSY
jgi:hypothetical protein